jgi:hypothetical protein
VEIYREGLERKFALSKCSWGSLGVEFCLARIVRVLESGVVGWVVCVDLIGALVDVSFGWGESVYRNESKN